MARDIGVHSAQFPANGTVSLLATIFYEILIYIYERYIYSVDYRHTAGVHKLSFLTVSYSMRLFPCLTHVITFRVSRKTRTCTDPDVTWRSGRGCPLVVYYWADLQSVHGLRYYGNITRTLVTSANAKCALYSLYA